jgi:GxxExxY protein|tara:strand:+ start:213 stop:722 length:510 start_codon:yes stop_codon:yes gene_type:complete
MIEDLAREIYSDLGPGYSERVYHNAMEVLLRERGIPYESERVVLIKFKGHVIGNLRIDMIIDNTTILEFKIIKSLNEAAELQGKNYLHLTGLKTAYLINYPPCRDREVEVRKIEVGPLGEEPVPYTDKTEEILDTEPLDLGQLPEEVLALSLEDPEPLRDNAAHLDCLN